MNTFYTTREEAMIMTQHLANRSHETAYTLFEDDGYHIASELDLLYWPDAAPIAEFRPATIGAVNWNINDVPDEPPPDDAPGTDDNGIPIADPADVDRVEWHMQHCPICAELPRCQSCGDIILDTGPLVCMACRDAGYCPVCGKEHHAWQCGGVLWLEEQFLAPAMPPYALMVA